MSEWIKNDGNCPDPEYALVDVTFRDGTVTEGVEVQRFNWCLSIGDSTRMVEWKFSTSVTGNRFSEGQRVEKIKGSSWRGRVVGFYSTTLTPIGYCVESEREPGSVQIYPESALREVSDE